MSMTVTSEVRTVIVTEVDYKSGQATCVNTRVGGEFKADIELVHGYNRPRPGDAWAMTKFRDMWAFDYLIEGQAQVQGIGSGRQLVDFLAESGVPWRPGSDLSPTIRSEIPTFGVIGERRLLNNLTSTSAIPVQWLKCDGSLQRIARYPLLFADIGTQHGGDGITTFALPNMVAPDAEGDGPKGFLGRATYWDGRAPAPIPANTSLYVASNLTVSFVAGRRYQIVGRTRAATGPTNNYLTRVMDVGTGLQWAWAPLGNEDYRSLTSGYFDGIHSEWNLTAPSTATFTLGWYVTSGAGGTTSVYCEDIPVHTFEARDLGKVTPATPSMSWYILAE
jgi:microcystin-dependent protein